MVKKHNKGCARSLIEAINRRLSRLEAHWSEQFSKPFSVSIIQRIRLACLDQVLKHTWNYQNCSEMYSKNSILTKITHYQHTSEPFRGLRGSMSRFAAYSRTTVMPPYEAVIHGCLIFAFVYIETPGWHLEYVFRARSNEHGALKIMVGKILFLSDYLAHLQKRP